MRGISLLDTILAEVPHGICVYGPDRRVRMFNRAYTEVMAGAPLAVGDTMVSIARAKLSLDPVSAVVRGILCNVLVCLAVWLCMAARSVADKILAILFPISAFVACGFEHSVANMYFLPLGIALTVGSTSPLAVSAALSNLAFVTIGNIVGGTLLVAFVYWAVYLKQESRSPNSAGM